MVLSFLDHELDRDLFELRRAGNPVSLEPRALELLLYLAENRERVVAKEELFEKVWKARFVSESALTRAVMKARQAVGDDGTGRVIKTTHGKGYRFVAQVVESSLPPPHPSGDPGAFAPRAAAGPASSSSAAANRSRRRAFLFQGVVLAGVAAVATLWLARRTSLPSGGAASGPPVRVAILPITVEDSEPEMQLLAVSTADLLSSRLERIPGLRVRGPVYGGRLTPGPAGIEEFVARTRVPNLVTGILRRSEDGSKAQLSVTLQQKPAEGPLRATPLGSYDIPLLKSASDTAGFVAVRDRIVERLTSLLLPAFALSSEATTAPHDLEAYRLYLLALERLSTATCEGSGPRALLERSLELDPRFAPAWAAYGLARYGLASSCGEAGTHYAAAVAAFDRALELAPGWGRAIGLKAAVLTEMGRAEDGFALVREPAKRHGSDDMQFAAAYALTYAGFLPEAKECLDALVESDPLFLTVGGWTPNALLYLGENDRFLELLPSTDTPIFRYYRGWALQAEGSRREEALRAVSGAFRQNPNDLFARLSSALEAILQNRSDEAGEVLRGLARQRRELDARDGEVSYKMAELFSLSGDADAALDELRQSAEQGFFCLPCLDRDRALEPLRHRPVFLRAREAVARRHLAFGQRFSLGPSSSRAAEPARSR